MSQTFKVNSAFVTDPKNLNWAALVSLVNGAFGQPIQSRMRSAILEFPALTPGQYNDWLAVCDVGPDYTSPGYITPGNPTLYLPRRTDAAYTNDPDAGVITPRDPTYIDLNVYYMCHFRGGTPGVGGLVYNTRIEVYTFIQISTDSP